MAFTLSVAEVIAADTSGLLSKHESWERIPLFEIASILNGAPFDSALFNTNNGMPLVRIRDVLSGQTSTYYRGSYEDIYVVEPGDLLIGMDGDFNCGYWGAQRSVLNQRVCKITPNEFFYDKRLLAYVLPGYLAAINANTPSVTVKHLSSKTIGEIDLPLPPRSEQNRIVEKLEELLSDLDAGVAELKAAQKKLVQYRQSLLKAAVEGKLTEQWRNNRYAASPQYLTHQERDATASETAANTPLSPRGRGVGGEGATTAGLPHNAWLRDRARELRKAQTPQEQALWQQLRAKRFSGFKFRRQQVIGRYIADFVCFEQKLVIELDGSQHSDTQQADAQRDRWLNAQGFRVLRFWNSQWQSQQVGVLEAIWQALHEEKPSPPLPNPSPTRGEGLSLTADVDMEGRSGSQPDASFYHDERGAGEAVETGAQLLERILKERRARWEAKQLAKFQEQGKIPPKGWQDKYPEPVQPDTRDLPELPEEWVWASLDQLTEFITSGSRGWADYYSDKGATFIRSQNINKDWLDLSDIAFVNPPRNSEGERTRVELNDLLLTITGANVGKAAVVKTQIQEAYVSQHVALIRPIDETLGRYLHLFLTSAAGGRGQLDKAAYGAGKPGLNLLQIKSVYVPLLPPDEGNFLIELLKTQFNAISEQSTQIAHTLKQSAAQRKNILKAAFSGQLVPQDPNDEPASVLLERIRAERAAKQTVKTPKNRTTRSTS